MTDDTASQGTPWVNYEEAMKRLRENKDAQAEQFVMRAVVLVINAYREGRVPSEKLDLLFYVEMMLRLWAQRESLARIIAGEDLRWWPDNG